MFRSKSSSSTEAKRNLRPESKKQSATHVCLNPDGLFVSRTDELIENNHQYHLTNMLEKINQLGIGPAGFGGTTTALAVNINTYPTHIAGLPVAVNICCHVNRHVVKIL